jgi:hypothetical protein
VVVSTQLTNIHDQFSYLLRVRCESQPGGLTLSEDALRITEPSTTYILTNVTLNDTPLSPRNAALTTLNLAATQRDLVQQVDFDYAAIEPDTDGDGLPDWWESLYPAAGKPDDDTDSDGLNNRREYVAGTNPLDPNSLFEFIHIEADAERNVRIQWSSVSGKSYALLRSPVLSSNQSDYTVVRAGILATPPTNTYQDSPPLSGSTWFYLLRVEP